MNRLYLTCYFLVFPIIVLTGCAKSPAEQCLESFRKNLVSPNSAKVFDFNDGKLTYLAKNRSGTEIQGKAICAKFGEKWERNAAVEYIEILQYSTKTMEANNNCRKNGEPKSYCDSMHKIVTPEAAGFELGYQ